MKLAYIKLLTSFLIFIITICHTNAQNTTSYNYSISVDQPYGALNPNAPEPTGDYELLIGKSQCKSYSKKKDGDWADPVDMTWIFKYIMNGTAVQDETLKADSSHSGSIRQYHADSTRWYVHYYSSKAPTATLAAWEGGLEDNEIILYRPQKAPNGTEGFFKIRFYDISKEDFKWLGVWTNTQETFAFETWKITCVKDE